MRRPARSRADREWRIQAEVVSALEKADLPILYAADMNAGRRSPREQVLAQATGIQSGEPDLRIYLPGGRVGFIELKAPGHRLSDQQRCRHRDLQALGHQVQVVTGPGQVAAAEVLELIRGWLREAGT